METAADKYLNYRLPSGYSTFIKILAQIGVAGLKIISITCCPIALLSYWSALQISGMWKGRSVHRSGLFNKTPV
jgi:hypothetical protein